MFIFFYCTLIKTMSTNTLATFTRQNDSFMSESGSALRFTLWVSFFVIIFLSISTMISRLCFKACADSILDSDSSLMYQPINFKSGCQIQEDFKNQQQEQASAFTFNYDTASKYQSIALTSVEANEGSLNMMVGQANRYLGVQNGKVNIILDMFANLYELGGNIYGETSTDQEYRAYGYTRDNKKIDLGKLIREKDGFSKLKIVSNDPSILQYNKIQIVYKTSKSEDIILTGTFEPLIQ